MKPSCVIDTCSLLNALSSDPVFLHKEQREKWLSKLINSESLKRDFEIWQGHGIALAYLMNGSDSMVSLFKSDPDKWRQEAGNNLHEPAYKSELEFTTAHRNELLALLDSISHSDFNNWWTENALPILIAKSQAINIVLNSRLDKSALSILNRFVQCSAKPYDPSCLPLLYVASFSSHDFNLAGGQACFRLEIDPDEAPSILLHEWLHSFNPNQAVARKHLQIAERDKLYAGAWKKIYVQGKEGEEEEFVVAAELYTAINSSIISKKGALRRIKNNYGGMPLAGLLFERLLSSYPSGLPADFDYNSFLEKALSSHEFEADNLAASFQDLIAPVKGIAGMKLSRLESGITVTKLFDSTAAVAAGIKEGDVIRAVDLQAVPNSLERTVDMICGRPGESFKLTVERNKEKLQIDLTLR